MAKLTTKKKHVIKFIVGDNLYDGCGHGQTEEFYVNCNISAAILEKYYKRHAKMLGFDLENICSEDEDDVIDKHDRAAIIKSGIRLDNIEDLEHPSPMDLVSLQLNVLQKMLPELEWSFMEIPHKTFQYSVGYGLF